MVSTRGVRYKFSEGERVLCYEPDPTKAKVLYDSKVLEVIESRDKHGRRTVEYLIHFQGWNSSWDRCVSEDFVLKDTEENRQLQRDLAEKSKLHLGAYLYRRERKRGGTSGTATGGAAKRTHQGYSDEGSSSSTQPDDGEAMDTDSSSGSATSRPRSPPSSQPGRAHIPLPAQLRDRLTFDYHLVVKRGKVSRLPASPTAAQILESYVKWFARAGAWHPPRGRHDPPHKPDMLDVSCRLNLVREVADGLRVYFDFVLRGHLLYKQEHKQYHELIGQIIEKQEEEAKVQAEKESGMPTSQNKARKDMSVVKEEIKSPKIPEYSHLPPDPDIEMKEEVSKYTHEEEPKETNDRSTNDKAANDRMALDKSVDDKTSNVKAAKETNDVAHPNLAAVPLKPPVKEVRSTVARRLRSCKSALSPSDSEESAPAPSTSTGEPRAFEAHSSVGSSASSVSECVARVTQPAAHTRTPLSLLLDKVAKWEIIPHDSVEPLPCRLYGAIHLARLFVKLPEFLNATQMPDGKLKLILKYIDMFVQYLDEHSEWFGESYYTSESSSRSH